MEKKLLLFLIFIISVFVIAAYTHDTDLVRHCESGSVIKFWSTDKNYKCVLVE
jgi:hypothetical protein